MRKKIFDDKFNMPTQLDVGTAEKEDTSPTETPYPLAKGSDGLPKFNALQDNQKKNLPQTLRSQVAFQQEALQYNNYQILNFSIVPTTSTTSQVYFNSSYNKATAVGSSLNETVMFSGISGGDNNDALYYNVVYANARYASALLPFTSVTLVAPSYIEFYPIQKIAGGSSAGGKIPVQISNTAYVSTTEITSSGTEFGVQSFGVDVYNENAYYTQSSDLKGIRCIGLALKEITLGFSATHPINNIQLDIEIGVDLKSGGSSY